MHILNRAAEAETYYRQAVALDANHGPAAFNLGALLVGYREGKILRYAGRVGTGFSDALLKKLHTDFRKLAATECPFDSLPTEGGRWGKGFPPAELKRCHWLRPELVCQVEFSEWTRDGRLRQPVFLGLRADKDAAEVTREEVPK